MKKYKVLYIGTILLISCVLLMFFTAKTEKNIFYNEMYSVSEKSKSAFDSIKSLKAEMGIDYSNHSSGMLGAELTGITTTLGSKESKGTVANPNFAAIVYNYIKELKLSGGDKVALNLSSSFPSLNIETIITVESMGYEPVIISSLGSSTYGATDINLTYLDMEHFLFEKNIISHKSIIYTLGGDYDTGNNMDPEVIKTITKRLENKDYKLFVEGDYDKNLQYRMLLYKNCKALINVGGNTISQTNADIGYFNDYGYLESNKIYNYDQSGLIGQFLSNNKDVIHLLNVKDIAIDNLMPLDPDGDIQIGNGGIYYKKTYSKILILFVIVIFLFILMRFKYERKKSISQNINEILQQKPFN